MYRYFYKQLEISGFSWFQNCLVAGTMELWNDGLLIIKRCNLTYNFWSR